MEAILQALREVIASGKRGAQATVVRSSGSVPQRVGARLLLKADGTTVGTVGGGAVEEEIRARLFACIQDGKPSLEVYDLARDLGMCCGGRMEVFVEAIEAQPRLILFGAGHVAQPTAEFARRVGFRVVVVDDREELNTEARFAGCERLLMEPAEARRALSTTSEDWLVVVTHDHRLDEEALDCFGRLPHRYIGIIGSRRKVIRILQRIAQRGTPPPLERVYAPIGLDLGAVTPEEISISIVSELVALRHGKLGSHMSLVDDENLDTLLGRTVSREPALAQGRDD